MVRAERRGVSPPDGGDSTAVIRLRTDPHDVHAAQWNGLLRASRAPTLFMRHEYLVALHASQSAVSRTGWTPTYLTLERDGELHAACPLFLKSHSYGEYVFDWAWADAYRRHGLRYYPKLLTAVPFTPVPGTRLLARTAADKVRLLQAVREVAEQEGHSSAHLLFGDTEDIEAARLSGWMLREAVQFHWGNREPKPFTDFTDFVATFQHDKRKKILQERRRVAEAGIRFTTIEPGQIDAGAWDFFYHCYTRTYHAHHSTPYLSRAFFEQVGTTLAPHWLMFIADRGGERIAASLVALDPENRVAYGRYWGSVEYVPCLHFEACYYQPLEWCIVRQYRRFEGGAQGEHKMARGLLPVRTASAHWLSEPAFAEAVAQFLQDEGASIEQYVDELHERSPFRQSPA